MNKAKVVTSSVGSGQWRIVWGNSFHLQGLGLAQSSQMLILNAALASYWLHEGQVDLRFVLESALGQERILAHGRRIAAQDVVTELVGGAVLVDTLPGSGVEVSWRVVKCDREVVARNMVFAHRREGPRHRAGDLLGALFGHRLAGKYVRELSECSEAAATALAKGAFADLAQVVAEGRGHFDQWSGGAFTSGVRPIGDQLDARFGARIGWKPAGAGACPSLIVVMESSEVRADVLAFFAGEGWVAEPVRVTDGLKVEVDPGKGMIRISVPLRLDLVGAADLGLDEAIGCNGVCCALAVEPRRELTLWQDR